MGPESAPTDLSPVFPTPQSLVPQHKGMTHCSLPAPVSPPPALALSLPLVFTPGGSRCTWVTWSLPPHWGEVRVLGPGMLGPRMSSPSTGGLYLGGGL